MKVPTALAEEIISQLNMTRDVPGFGACGDV